MLQALRLWLHPPIPTSGDALKQREVEAEREARNGFKYLQQQRKLIDRRIETPSEPPPPEKRPLAGLDTINHDLDEQDEMMRRALGDE